MSWKNIKMIITIIAALIVIILGLVFMTKPAQAEENEQICDATILSALTDEFNGNEWEIDSLDSTSIDSSDDSFDADTATWLVQEKVIRDDYLEFVFARLNGYLPSTESELRPVINTDNEIRISCGFNKKRGNGIHGATDVPLIKGTEIVAMANGMIIKTGWSSIAGRYMIMRSISINGDTLLILLAHLSKFIAKNGEFVEAGDVLALSGNSGHSTGPHLHCAVKLNGKLIDFAYYLQSGDLPDELTGFFQPEAQQYIVQLNENFDTVLIVASEKDNSEKNLVAVKTREK